MVDEGDEDDDLFARAMRGVRPVRKTATRIHATTDSAPPVKPAAARATPSPLPSVSVQAPQTGDLPWTLCASGVSRERLRRLAAAPSEREIDLHGSTRDEALRNLEAVVAAALAAGVRTLCVVHGRGLHSQGRPVLKQAVFQWLREGPYAAYVLAAVPRVGSGGGASTVLLRREKR